MNKLVDINYALLAQLSYLYWNKLKNEDIENFGTKKIDYLLKDSYMLGIIKTDFYNNPKHFPSNESIYINPEDEKSKIQGGLPPYVYHGDDKRLLLAYSLDDGKKPKAKFGEILDGWEYLDCATGEMIENKFFDKKLLEGYKESGFFGVAFQRGDDIIIAYRGTETEELSKDGGTDLNIYFKQLNIQQVEAVLFYEYIRRKYGKENGKNKKIYITGHSLAGALAQYVHLYATWQEYEIGHTVTWNGLGTFGSALTPLQFSMTEDIRISPNDSLIDVTEKLREEQKKFRVRIESIEKEDYGEKLKKFYSLTGKELREYIKDNCNNFRENITNYYMHEDFVGGYLNGDYIGRKVAVDIENKKDKNCRNHKNSENEKEKLIENIKNAIPVLILLNGLFSDEKVSLKNKGILTKIGYVYLVSSVLLPREKFGMLIDEADEVDKAKISYFIEKLKTMDISEISDYGKDMIVLLLNFLDEDEFSKNCKESLAELRRYVEKIFPPVEKGLSSYIFHGVNNFLAFMNDSGNIEVGVMRKEFRWNALKTIVQLKSDFNYKFLKGIDRNNKKDQILEIKNYNVEQEIYQRANRLIYGGIFVPFPITQTDILFRENFILENFTAKDMDVNKNKPDGKYIGEITLGIYNNIARLGGIHGQSPVKIKIYVVGLEEVKVKEDKKKVITFGIEEKEHSYNKVLR